MSTRTISVSHLVFGLIFLGAAVLWTVGAATGADAPDVAVVAPAVLIGAGVAGLVAIVVNARNARVNAEKAGRESYESHESTAYADDGVANHEEQQ